LSEQYNQITDNDIPGNTAKVKLQIATKNATSVLSIYRFLIF